MTNEINTEINDSVTEDNVEINDIVAPSVHNTDDIVDTAVDAEPVVAEEPEVDQDAGDDDQPDGKPRTNREARQRVQLRETKAKLSAAEATIDSLQRAAVEGRAVGKVANPASLWASEHMTMAALLNENGVVDTVKADAAIKAAAFALGLKNAWDGPVVPREGTGYGGYKDTGKSSWEGAFSSE